MNKHLSTVILSLFVCMVCAASGVYAQGAEKQNLSLKQWNGPRREIKGLEGKKPSAVGYPEQSAEELKFESQEPLPPGLYRVQLTLRPSHTHSTTAWKGSLDVSSPGDRIVGPSSWLARQFARQNKQETISFRVVHRRKGTLQIILRASIDPEIFAQEQAKNEMKEQGDNAAPMQLGGEGDDDDLMLGATFQPLSPKDNFYFALEEAKIEKLSETAWVSEVATDRIRYRPGAQVEATVTLGALRTPVEGTLRLSFRNGVNDSTIAAEQSVTLEGNEVTKNVTVQLPENGALGYGLVAEWTSDGDRSEASEYFTVTDNFYRTAIVYVHPVHNATFKSSYEGLAKSLQSNYFNVREIFFWAEEDMVELSPDTEYWFSGQTAYHISKKGLQAMIRDLQDRGIAAVTYAKFVLSGFLGWDYAYSYPLDHKNQYGFSVGKWGVADTAVMDRFRNKEFVGHGGGMEGLLSKGAGYVPFVAINPDPTPRNARTAAEEMMRSVEMFGWDGLRWDGHPRGAVPGRNSTGGARPENFNVVGHRKTQALIRYLKEIIKQEYPNFRHGYNYLSANKYPTYEIVEGNYPDFQLDEEYVDAASKPAYGWAVEDYELDELSREGGLLMNESIGNHSFGKKFAWYAANLQEEGDLAREHGGFYLAINRAEHARDQLICGVLGYAGGARPYTGETNADIRLLNRYATRFADYVFDEDLRRITRPDNMFAPQSNTDLWWDGFVYETPEQDGRREIVMNLLNIDLEQRINPKQAEEIDLSLPPGTDPFSMNVQLPENYTLRGAKVIDPFSLNVRKVSVDQGRVQVPAVGLWKVLVLETSTSDADQSLADRWGPPRTEDKERKNLEREDPGLIKLDPDKPVEEVSARWREMFPDAGGNDWWQEPEDLPTLSREERNRRLLEERKPLKPYLKGYPYGLKVPSDRKLRDDPPEFSDLSPSRNGRTDVFFARGVLSERLRLYEALAGADPVNVDEARYHSSFNAKAHGLRNNLRPEDMSAYDVLVYADVPHAAIGVKQSYAMVDYVRSGGGVLFCGGEYAFGKGRYAHTVLDRDLLPVRIVRPHDNRYSPQPLTMEPGPDWEELGVEADFDASPVFWGWNEVAIRPDSDVKVFLKAGNRPVLVGWKLGEGRVASLLAMYRGHSNESVTAFFDWKDWPKVLDGTVRWLAPRSLQQEEMTEQLSRTELDQLAGKLEKGGIGDMLDAGLDEEPGEVPGMGPGGGESSAEKLDEEKLSERLATIRELMKGEGARVSKMLAQQLVRIANIPEKLRVRMIRFIYDNPCEGLGKIAEPALEDSNLAVRGSAYALVAMSGNAQLFKSLENKTSRMSLNPTNRKRYFAMAVAVFRGDGLTGRATQRLSELKARREENRQAYTGGEEFSMKHPEKPLLSSERLFERMGWLAYMARQKPEEYAPAFVRQWARIPQYKDYCERAIASTIKGMRHGGDKESGRRRIKKLKALQHFFDAMDGLVTPTVYACFEDHGTICAETLREVRFLLEIKRVIDLIGRFPVGEMKSEHEVLMDAEHNLLRQFVRGRLRRMN